MSDSSVKSVMITGANKGIGNELARQLAERREIERIILACRNPTKAQAAKAELEASTKRKIFEVVKFDTNDPASARAVAESLDTPIDALVMNAGSLGGREPSRVTASGTTQVFADNILGHVALLDALLEKNALRKVAVLAGSEAARGVPKLKIKRPSFSKTSVADLVSAIDGSYYAGKKFDPMGAFGQVKYIGALWMAAVARQYPELRFLTISPGATRGTDAPGPMPAPQRFVTEKIMMGGLFRIFGLSHSTQKGAARFAEAVTNTTYGGGRFYASGAKTLSGPLIDQAEIFPDLANQQFQDNANEAVHRFLTTTAPRAL